jgi:cobalt/nickel transport system permease protein
MHVHFLDPFQDKRSPVHALDSRVKFVLALAFIVSVSASPAGAWPAYVLFFALALAMVLLADLDVWQLLRRAVIVLPFALAALPLIVTGPELRQPLGIGTLSFSQPGVIRFASILTKSYISMLIALVLAASTSFPQLLIAMRALRLPRLLVAIFGLMWRYIFVLVDEAMRLLRARDARSGARGGHATGGSIVWRARVTGGMAGNLFLRSFERGDRIYDAMAARGYDGEARGLRQSPVPVSGWLALTGGVLLLLVLFALARVFGG